MSQEGPSVFVPLLLTPDLAARDPRVDEQMTEIAELAEDSIVQMKQCVVVGSVVGRIHVADHELLKSDLLDCRCSILCHRDVEGMNLGDVTGRDGHESDAWGLVTVANALDD